MKKLAAAVGTLLFVAPGALAPLSANAQIFPQRSDSALNSGQVFRSSSSRTARQMDIYSDCLESHANISGADFKQVNKFCACVSDQSIQENNTGSLSSCAADSGGGGTLGTIGEVAPAVLIGVLEGITNSPEKSGGLFGKSSGGLLDGLGGLGSILGGSSGGFGLKDIFKNR